MPAELSEYQQLTQRLLELAGRFYTNAESPSEEDMGTVFYYLALRDGDALEKFINTFEGVVI